MALRGGGGRCPGTFKCTFSVAVAETETITVKMLHVDGKLNVNTVDIARGVPFLRVLVNGISVCGTIDTGSDRTVVDLEFARTQGFDVIETKGIGLTNSNAIQISSVPNVPVEVPGQFSFVAEVVGIDLPEYECPDAGDLKFILGMDILQGFAIAIDPKRQMIAFAKSGNIKGRGDQWMRIDWTDGLVTGRINDHPARLRVDTGSAFLALVPENRFHDYFPGRALEELPPSTDAAGRQEKNVGIRLGVVEVGEVVATHEITRVSATEGPADGNLGFPFFTTTTTIFDAGQSVIFMKKPKPADD